MSEFQVLWAAITIVGIVTILTVGVGIWLVMNMIETATKIILSQINKDKQ